MGIKQEIYTFDSTVNPSDTPVSVVASDTRTLAETQDELVDAMRYQRKLVLAMTDDEVAEEAEYGKKDKALADHRKKVRTVCNTSIKAIKDATSLKELDAVPWSTDLIKLKQEEFPDSMIKTDPTKKPKITEPKSSTGDEIPK